MSEVSYRLTIDDNGASDELLGFYANQVESLFQGVINFHKESHPLELAIGSQVALGNVASNLLTLGALIKEDKPDEDKIKSLLDELGTDTMILASYMLQLNYSLRGNNDGQTE